MKNFGFINVLVTLAFFVFGQNVQATPVAAVAGIVGPILMPIVQEESRAIASAIVGGVKSLSEKSTRCNLLCNGTGPITPCKTAKGLSACKAMCQETKQLGGYEVKLRYWKNGSVANCLKAAVKSGIQTADGKGNTKSISIYTQEDLDLLVELISYINAAEKVIISNGGKLDIKVSSKEIADARKQKTYSPNVSNQEIEQSIKKIKANDALKNARDVKKHAQDEIDNLVKEGRFGPQ